MKEEEVKSSIETLLESWETALNASDTNAMMDLWGANPVLMPQNSQTIIGRDATRRFHDQTFKSIKFDEHFAIHEVESLGDVAWVRSSSTARARNLASDKEIEASANELWIFHRENGGWKVHRYIFAADLPVAFP